MMAYLTYDEYRAYGYSTISTDSFSSIEQNAEQQFDIATKGYYVANSLSDDTDTNRVVFFKKALAMQCEFVAKTGISSTADLVENSVKSISIGRTSVTRSVDYTNEVDQASGICYTALNILALTGLLFRGVGAIWHP